MRRQRKHVSFADQHQPTVEFPVSDQPPELLPVVFHEQRVPPALSRLVRHPDRLGGGRHPSVVGKHGRCVVPIRRRSVLVPGRDHDPPPVDRAAVLTGVLE